VTNIVLILVSVLKELNLSLCLLMMLTLIYLFIKVLLLLNIMSFSVQPNNISKFGNNALMVIVKLTTLQISYFLAVHWASNIAIGKWGKISLLQFGLWNMKTKLLGLKYGSNIRLKTLYQYYSPLVSHCINITAHWYHIGSISHCINITLYQYHIASISHCINITLYQYQMVSI
jgi:hypothetical protein